MRCYAEVDEERDRIVVFFPYNPEYIAQLKRRIGGASFRPGDAPRNPYKRPHWRVPLNLSSMDRLRELWGPGLQVGPRLKVWEETERRMTRRAKRLGLAKDANLLVVPQRLRRLHRRMSYPEQWRFQRADTAFMAGRSCINADQPGMGKTRVIPAAAAEAELLDGPHLVVAPVTSAETVWEYELGRFQPHPVLASEDRDVRLLLLEEAERLYSCGKPFWLVVNADMLRFEAAKDAEPELVDGKLTQPRRPRFPFLTDAHWATVTVDEFHLLGLGDPRSLFAEALYKVQAQRRWALSGTPMGGKPLRLWGALHFVDPVAFSSRWAWGRDWLKTEPNPWAESGVSILNELNPAREPEFYPFHAPWIIRRERREYLPLEDPVYVDVWCRMTRRQRVLYDKMAKDAEVRIDGQQLVAAGVLAEYGRLKQFADCRWSMDHGALQALPDSGKLPHLMDRLAERGIALGEPVVEKAIVGSQYKDVAEMVWAHIERAGISAALMTGDTRHRTEIQRAFQREEHPRVLVMTTQTGGVSINLNRADSVHILDETWNPDDTEQFAGRPDRGARTTPVTVYVYRSRGTIEEYVRDVNIRKKGINELALDLRRRVVLAR